jgi:hypothetical protein
MTALRLLQRMKRDWMHTGRRPSGLCGAGATGVPGPAPGWAASIWQSHWLDMMDIIMTFCTLILFCVCVCVVLGIKSKASCMLGKCCITRSLP